MNYWTNVSQDTVSDTRIRCVPFHQTLVSPFCTKCCLEGLCEGERKFPKFKMPFGWAQKDTLSLVTKPDQSTQSTRGKFWVGWHIFIFLCHFLVAVWEINCFLTFSPPKALSWCVCDLCCRRTNVKDQAHIVNATFKNCSVWLKISIKLFHTD